MKIAVDHAESKLIMDWLYDNYDVKGDEEDLIDEPIENLICESGRLKLEEYLGLYYDTAPIMVSVECKFIEVK